MKQKVRGKSTVSFRIDNETLKNVRKLAQADSRTLTSYITHLIIKDMLPVQRQRILNGVQNGKLNRARN